MSANMQQPSSPENKKGNSKNYCLSDCVDCRFKFNQSINSNVYKNKECLNFELIEQNQKMKSCSCRLLRSSQVTLKTWKLRVGRRDRSHQVKSSIAILWLWPWLYFYDKPLITNYPNAYHPTLSSSRHHESCSKRGSTHCWRNFCLKPVISQQNSDDT